MTDGIHRIAAWLLAAIIVLFVVIAIAQVAHSIHLG